MEVGADLVALTLLQVVALSATGLVDVALVQEVLLCERGARGKRSGAYLEKTSTLLGITWGRC